MPLYGFAILLNIRSWIAYTLFPQLRTALYILVLITTFILPALTVLMLWRRRYVTSLDMRNRRERNWPYIFALAYYLLGWMLLRKLPLPSLFGNIIMGASVAILVAFVINLKWKISIHMTGIGGLAGMFYGFAMIYNLPVLLPLMVLAVVAGLTGSARLALQIHTPSQVYAGFILGFGLQWFFTYIYNVLPVLLSPA
jgi:hypothetical protein